LKQQRIATAHPPAGFGAMSKPQNGTLIADIGCWNRFNLRED
jgi:hypothetical protein